MTASAGSGADAPGSELRGILLYIGALVFFSTMDVVAKWLVERHDPVMVVWARYASQAFWTVVLLAPRMGRVIRTSQPGLQVIRAVMPFGATMCFFTALQTMQIAEAVAIFEVAPLFMTILAFFLLKEKVGPRRWTGVAIGFVGAMIIIRPGTDVFTPAMILPLASAFCYASYAIATRWMGQSESPWTAFFYTAMGGALLASLVVPFHWSTPSWQDGIVMGLFGVIGGCGHMLMILALRRASASTIAPISYLGLVFSAIWGLVVFGQFPDGWTVVGAVVVVGAGLYVWWRERVRAGQAS
ncbi:DMT family transporter [Albimonas sp. CAU 1670]|uniref:DMT family transporter n=1 Tax=Albimonas sp. CAU 1670 TaxID=3032599 RepID=UPI0023DC8C75|nr:DMT family transporter [Albimonas sp. CAU 1670]MDF2231330.1 DMT family transporter [Albimonas sp. CAU 1670]